MSCLSGHLPKKRLSEKALPMPRNLVVCCDGTNNSVCGDATNVLRLYQLLERSERQVACYDAGVGTVVDPTKVTSFGRWLYRRVDMGIGHSLRENVCRAYRFLSSRYQEHDRIFLFGFSRGAYTVRALAGMIHLTGLMRPELEGLERHAWAAYADRRGKDRFASAGRFRRSFAIDHRPKVHFVGAWDTVSSYGWVWNLRSTPHTADNPSVTHVRHALAIDERRAMFQPNLFRPKKARHASFKEVWFAGGHGDVGGGWPPKQAGLARIALRWMCAEAEGEGLWIDSSQRTRHLKGEDAQDLTTPVNDALTAAWWPLELVPRRCWSHAANGMRWNWPHLGRRREVPAGALLHPTVLEKLAADPDYHPSNLRRQGASSG